MPTHILVAPRKRASLFAWAVGAILDDVPWVIDVMNRHTDAARIEDRKRLDSSHTPIQPLDTPNGADTNQFPWSNRTWHSAEPMASFQSRPTTYRLLQSDTIPQASQSDYNTNNGHAIIFSVLTTLKVIRLFRMFRGKNASPPLSEWLDYVTGETHRLCTELQKLWSVKKSLLCTAVIGRHLCNLPK